MIVGTTPTHHFNIPFDVSMVAEARVIYKQAGREILRKETESFRMEGQRLSVSLTQEETFRFDFRAPVKLQLRVRTTAGQVLSTRALSISAGECLDTEVI